MYKELGNYNYQDLRCSKEWLRRCSNPYLKPYVFRLSCNLTVVLTVELRRCLPNRQSNLVHPLGIVPNGLYLPDSYWGFLSKDLLMNMVKYQIFKQEDMLVHYTLLIVLTPNIEALITSTHKLDYKLFSMNPLKHNVHKSRYMYTHITSSSPSHYISHV